MFEKWPTITVRHSWKLAASACIGLVALLLRLVHLGEQEVWFDEVVSVHRATVDEHILDTLRVDDTPFFYYLLLRAWLSAAEITETTVRLPSAIAGALCVLAVIWAGWQIFSPAAGLWAGAFVAVAPIHIYYSQEARNYALLTLELALAYGCAWRAMRSDTWGAWILVSLAALAALDTHYLGTLGLLPIFFAPWVWPPDAGSAERRRRLLITALITVLLWLPWLVLAFYPYTHALVLATTTWIVSLWEYTPPALMLPRTIEVFTLGPERDMSIIAMKQFTGLSLPAPLWWMGIGVVASLLLWIAVPWQDGGLKIPWLARRKLWAGSIVVTPLVIMWVGSFIRPVYVLGRYDMLAFVGFALLVGLALAKLQSVRKVGRILAVLAALGLLVPITAKLTQYYQAKPARYAQETAQALDEIVENGDVVILSLLRGLPQLIFYLPKKGYEWKEDTCRNVRRNREFTCRLFMPEASQVTSWSPQLTTEMAQSFVYTSLGAIKPGRTGLWAVVGDIRAPSGILANYGIDDLFGRELLRAGFHYQSFEINGTTLLFRFSRDATVP